MKKITNRDQYSSAEWLQTTHPTVLLLAGSDPPPPNPSVKTTPSSHLRAFSDLGNGIRTRRGEGAHLQSWPRVAGPVRVFYEPGGPYQAFPLGGDVHVGQFEESLHPSCSPQQRRVRCCSPPRPVAVRPQGQAGQA